MSADEQHSVVLTCTCGALWPCEQVQTSFPWCGRFSSHGPHDDCAGWGEGRAA